MSRRGGLAGSAAVMFAGTLTSRVLGLVRSALLIAAIYTLGGAADAFAVANKLPNIIYMLLAGGVLNAVLVPQIVRAMRAEDGGQEYVNRLLTLAGTLLAAVTVLLTLAAPVLVTLYAAEFRSGPWASVAVAFAMWCLPQLFFYGMYTLLGQVLNARSVFGPYMWAPAVNNLFAIIGLIAYIVVFGSFDPANPDPASAFTGGRVALLAGSATLGVAAQAGVLVIPLVRSGFKFRFTWGIRGSGLGRATRVAWWAFLALLAGQVGYLAISNLAAAASTAAAEAGTYAAGNAAWDNAFLVFMLPQSLITVSLVTAIFTRLSSNAAAGQSRQVRDDLSMGLRTLGVFTMFAAGALAVLAVPVVQVVQFDVATFEAYRAVGAVLVALATGLPAIAIWTMTQRVYFAYEDTKALFYFQIPMALIQILGCLLTYLLLPVQWWVVGSAVANATSLLFGALISFLALRRKLYSLDGARILRTYLRLTLALIPTIAVGWGLLTLWGIQTNFAGALARVLLIGGLMGVIYLICLRRLRVGELDILFARIGAMAEPLTARLAPFAARIPALPQMRTMWTKVTGTERHRRATGMNRPPEGTLNVGDVLAGRYLLQHEDRVNGRWLGTDTILDKQVHITTVAGPRREAALDAARRAALIVDDRLIRILRVGIHEGTGFIVTEVLQGQSLAELLAPGRLHPEQARTLIGEAAGALEVARRRGVHHLRLGPESLHRTPSGHVVLTGLAVDAAAAGIGMDNARAAARSDTVDLVALLYTALTGMWPGPKDRNGGLPAAPRHQRAPVPPAEVADAIPDDLDTLCAVTFGPHQDGPYTPGELVRDLAPWTDPGSGPIHHDAGPPQPHEQDGTHHGGSHPAPGGGPAGTAQSAPGPAALGAAGAMGAGAAAAGSAVSAAPGTPPPPVDTSRWAPRRPPRETVPPRFEEVVAPSAQSAAANVLDTYVARHERPTFDGSIPGTQSGGATAARQGGEHAHSLPPTAAPPPGTVPDHGDVGTAEVHHAVPQPVPGGPGGAAQMAERATAAGGAGSVGFAGSAASGAAQAGSAGAGAAHAGAAAGTSAGAGPSLAERAAQAARRARSAAQELTSTWRTPPEDDVDSPPAAASPATRAETAGDPDDEQYPEFVAHPTVPTGMEPPDDADHDEDLAWEEEDEPERFNPTPVVILSMIAAVVVAGVLALTTLSNTSYEPETTPAPTTPAPVEEETDDEQDAAGEPEEEPEEEETEDENDGPDPVIDSVRSLDDNPDLAYLVTDGNPDTIWRSLRYNDPRYGMKDGLGFVIELEEPAMVTQVTLDVQGEGGTVQIRADAADNPAEGPVLAEGPMGPEVTYELAEPVETDEIVLWFPELPVADSDGRNRIELAQVSVR